jgi:hypothetical protein
MYAEGVSRFAPIEIVIQREKHRRIAEGCDQRFEFLPSAFYDSVGQTLSGLSTYVVDG